MTRTSRHRRVVRAHAPARAGGTHSIRLKQPLPLLKPSTFISAHSNIQAFAQTFAAVVGTSTACRVGNHSISIIRSSLLPTQKQTHHKQVLNTCLANRSLNPTSSSANKTQRDSSKEASNYSPWNFWPKSLPVRGNHGR